MKLKCLIERMPKNTECSIRIRFELWNYEKILDLRKAQLGKLKTFENFEVGNLIAVGDNKIKLSIYNDTIFEEKEVEEILKKYEQKTNRQ